MKRTIATATARVHTSVFRKAGPTNSWAQKSDLYQLVDLFFLKKLDMGTPVASNNIFAALELVHISYTVQDAHNEYR